MLHLEYYRRKFNYFKWEISYGPPNMAGVTDAHRRFYVENQTAFSFCQKYFWIFRIDFWHRECFILNIIEGNWILFNKELARAPKHSRGHGRTFSKSHCVKRINLALPYNLTVNRELAEIFHTFWKTRTQDISKRWNL